MRNWKENGKSASLAGSAFNMNLASVGLGNGTGDAEPQTDALFVSVACVCGPVKPVEDLLLLILAKANPSINNFNRYPIVIGLKR